MIQILTFTEGHQWDDLVLGFPGADLRQGHNWGEIRRRSGWTPVRLAAFADGRCLAALAALVRRASPFGAIAYAPRGPLFHAEDERAAPALAALVAAVRATSRATFLRTSPALAPDDPALGALAAAGLRPIDDFWSVWNTPRNVMRLSLEGSEHDILGRMARKRRQHISTAEKKGIVIEASKDLETLRRFYGLLEEHGARNRYPVRGWDYFEAMWRAFAPQNALALIQGLVGGEVACSMLAVRFGTTAHALHVPSGAAARGVPVGDVVHWELIRWAKAVGCTRVDFGSSGTHVPPRETDPMLGIFRFKIEIGCQLELQAPYHDAVFAPTRYRAFRLAERRVLPRVRFWLRRLPAGVRGLVGRGAA